MCWRMADGVQSQEKKPTNFRERLAVAVRSIQWSYAIFWSLSTTQTGVLEWGDGYYNGDIKTRKTVQVMDFHADKIGLQRSEQLRELYESLLEGETEQAAKRPSTALSPEDLSDAEWYYLVCMSFEFNPGQCLPGRTLTNGQSIWLCNAPYAESKAFSRSLLARSASIQTVVCFPHLGGVIELGVTELVSEDPTLIQHIKTSLLELSKPVCSKRSSSAPCNTDDDKDPKEEIGFDQNRVSELNDNIDEDYNEDSPLDCSNDCDHNHLTEDSFVLEGVNDFSNGAQGSMNSTNSSDCISHALANPERKINVQLKEQQECSYTKFNNWDLGKGDDLHYKKTISIVLERSHQLIEKPCFRSCDCKSSFRTWRKGGMVDGHRPQAQQTMIKKILTLVPLMHGGSSLFLQKGNGEKGFLCKPDGDDVFVEDAFSDEGKEDGKFLILRSLVPTVTKIDKTSILHDTIEYLKELEVRVEELESCMDLTNDNAEGMRKHSDMVEQTSDNYEERKTETGKKPWLRKRKASDIDETEVGRNKIVAEEAPKLDIRVKVKEEDVLVEIRCPWRDYLLIDFVDTMNNMHLDAYSVQSSTTGGILNLTLQAKFRGLAVASAGMIKQALWRIASKY